MKKDEFNIDEIKEFTKNFFNNYKLHTSGDGNYGLIIIILGINKKTEQLFLDIIEHMTSYNIRNNTIFDREGMAKGTLFTIAEPKK